MSPPGTPKLAGNRHERDGTPSMSTARFRPQNQNQNQQEQQNSKNDDATNQCSVTLRTTDVDLPMDTTGKIYHLDCREADLADNVILVGDPGRVPVVAGYFDKDSVRFDNMHREIRIMTGTFKGVPISALSTGMGTDNIEIVMNEIHAIKEKNVEKNTWAEKPAPVKLIRVGTCGSPHDKAQVGMLAVTRYVIGMDNTCRYYKRPKLAETDQKLQDVVSATAFGQTIGPYVGHACPELADKIVAASHEVNKERGVLNGITASGSGFYGCQGRETGRLKLGVPSLIPDLASVRVGGDQKKDGTTELRVGNIEMECSSLCVLSELLGYQASAVCVIVATRVGDDRQFASPEVSKAALADAIQSALIAITRKD